MADVKPLLSDGFVVRPPAAPLGRRIMTSYVCSNAQLEGLLPNRLGMVMQAVLPWQCFPGCCGARTAATACAAWQLAQFPACPHSLPSPWLCLPSLHVLQSTPIPNQSSCWLEWAGSSTAEGSASTVLHHCPPPQVATPRVRTATKKDIPHINDHISKLHALGNATQVPDLACMQLHHPALAPSSPAYACVCAACCKLSIPHLRACMCHGLGWAHAACKGP